MSTEGMSDGLPAASEDREAIARLLNDALALWGVGQEAVPAGGEVAVGNCRVSCEDAPRRWILRVGGAGGETIQTFPSVLKLLSTLRRTLA